MDLGQKHDGNHERHRHRPEVEHHSPRRVVHSHRHLADAIGQRAGEVAKEVALRMTLEVAIQAVAHAASQRWTEHHQDRSTRPAEDQDADVEG